MTLLLSLLFPSAFGAVPYDLCVRAPNGNLSNVGGTYSDPQSGDPDPYQYEDLCTVGGRLRPSVYIETPVDKTRLNSWAKVDVRAVVTDPERGAGHCRWYFRRYGVTYPVRIKTPTMTRESDDQLWSATGICQGTVNLSAFAFGEGQLIVEATDLYASGPGTDETTLVLNQTPTVAMTVSPSSVVSPGEVVTLDISIRDDDAADGREVAVYVEDETGAVVDSTTCAPITAMECSTTLVTPLASGDYTIIAEYADPNGAAGAATAALRTDTEPTLALSSDVTGPYHEAGDELTLTLSILDPELDAPPDPDSIELSSSAPYDGPFRCDTLTGEAGSFTCTVTYTPSGQGYFTVTASYDDGSGRGPFETSMTLLNQRTSSLAAWADDDFVDPGATYFLYFQLDDESPDLGTLTVTLIDIDSGATYLVPVGVETFADGFAAFNMADVGAIELYLTFVDQYGYTFTSDTVEVYGNTAPDVALLSPTAAGAVIEATKLDEDTSDGLDTRIATWSFDIDDVDADAFGTAIDALTVLPDDGLPQPATCVHATDGRGTWECEVDVSDWDIDSYAFAVTVDDGHETTSVELELAVVGDTDYDYDGDGVTEADDYSGAVYLGSGWGDCAPDNPEVYGRSLRDGVAYDGAPEVCDDWDNDCDGEINEDAADADDDTRETATTYVDGEAYGSLHNSDDVDWWYFEAAEDRTSSNATFGVRLTVQEDGTGTPDGDWLVDAVAWTPSNPADPFGDGVETERPPVLVSESCDGSGWCTVEWVVASHAEALGEIRWWLGVHAADGWSASMCADDDATTTYTLEIVE